MLKEIVVRMLPEEVVWKICEVMYKMGITKPLLNDIIDTGRMVEYPWVLSHLPVPKGNVLDVGFSGSYFPILLANLGYKVWGIDTKNDKYLSKLRHPYFIPVITDVRGNKLDCWCFNFITAISTIEHIGLKEDGDFTCMNKLYDLLEDDGCVLVTAPFGKAATFKGYRVYDGERVKRMWKGKIQEISFFRKCKGMWFSCDESDMQKVEMDGRGKCTALFCAVLTK